jgi:SAM-dependent methyltransferase
MISCRLVRRLMLALCFSMVVAVVFAQAQQGEKEYVPVERQDGKDVVWLPTAQALVDNMLDMAKVTSQDYVIDLGSGDGRLVITAAKRGARALGIEYNPDMVALSKRNATKEGVSDRAQFIKADLYESDFSQATVITMFLLPEINLKLRPRILGLKPGTRIVSNSFDMSDWHADETAKIEDQKLCSEYCNAYLWIVPAKVEGAWKLPQGEFALQQTFQMVTGTLTSGGKIVPIANGRLKGEQISFSVGPTWYTGRVSGDSMSGTLGPAGGTATWTATRNGGATRAPTR